MNKKNCDICDNCIEFYSTTCVKMGIEVQELGIECGDNLDDVILKLGGVTKVEGECTNEYPSSNGVTPVMAASELSAGAGHSFTNITSSCATQITDTKFEYTLKNTNVNTEFSYTLGFTRNLPVGFRMINTEVSVVGPEGYIASGSSNSYAFNIKPNQFPASVRISVRVISPCGQLELKKDLSLPSNASTGTFISNVVVNDLSASLNDSDLNQEQYNKVIESEVNILKNRVEAVESVDLSSDVASLQTSVSTLEAVNVAAMEFIVPTCGGGTETKTLTELLSSLTQSICDLNGEISTLRNDYEVLKARVDNFPSTITVS